MNTGLDKIKMTKEEKDLLLKDFCGRLPYGVKIEVTYSKDSGSSLRARLCCEGINILDTNILGLFQQSEIYIKPYLFPMSSMTKEQEEELKNMYYSLINGMFYYTERIFDGIPFSKMKYFPYQIEEFFNKNHIDYRGLIPMGLAKDATGLNIY